MIIFFFKHTFYLDKILKRGITFQNEFSHEVINNISALKFHLLDNKNSLLILPPEKESISIIEQVRSQHENRMPILLFSFESEEKTSKRFTTSFNNNLPIITFGEGTYHIKLPVRLPVLTSTIKKVKPLHEAQFKKIKDEYEILEMVEDDRTFRHKCANLAGAIRIFQGAYYSGDIDADSYKSIFKSLEELCQQKSELKSYQLIIKKHLSLPIPPLSNQPKEFFNKDSSGCRILLLDDEAERSGWSIILKGIFETQGYNFNFEKDREKFLTEFEEKNTLACDIILLDLNMPDRPERSIHLIKRIKEKFKEAIIIVFSAMNDIRYFKDCKEAGAFDYFIKEFGHEDRDPVKYYKKLKWLIDRSKKLISEKKVIKTSSGKNDTPAIYSVKTAVSIPLTPDERDLVYEEWNSYFAFTVISAGVNTSQNLREIEEKRNRIVSWLIREPSENCCLSLRYIFDPVQGALNIVFIGKEKAFTKGESIKKSMDMYNNMVFLLKDFNAYHFEAIFDEKDLFSLLEPFNPVEIAAIGREDIMLDFENYHLTGSQPFSFNQKTYLDKMIKVFFDYDEPVMLNISLSPQHIKEELNDLSEKLQEIKAVWKKLYLKKTDRFDDYDQTYRQRDDGILNASIIKQFEACIKTLKNGCLFSRLDIIASSAIPSMLIETLRYDFFGDKGKIKITRYPDNKLDKEWNRIKALDFEKQTEKEKILAAVMDISQANCIFQLPLPKANGILGIKKEELNILPVPVKIKKTMEDEKAYLIANGFSKKKTVPVRLKADDLMQHLYICGKSGSGKTTLLLTLALSIVEKGKGVCLIDPHGDLANTFIEHIPEKRRDDLIFLNPIDPNCNFRLNILENDGTESQQEAVYQEVMSILLRLYIGKHMGPIFERYAKYTLLLIMYAGKTLADFSRIWADNIFRNKCLNSLNENLPGVKEIKDFWERELPDMLRGSEGKGLESYIKAKFDRFSSNEVMKRILSSPGTDIDFDTVINGGKILVIRLPKGPLGELDANMLGMVILFKLRQAVMRRERIPEKDREDFFLIVDEFQHFISSGGLVYSSNEGAAFSSLLSEARKFRVSNILANQFIYQLGKEMKNAVFGNVQSRVLFGLGADDAAYIEGQIPDGPDKNLYVSCPNYYASAQLLIDGEQVGPFTINTIPR